MLLFFLKCFYFSFLSCYFFVAKDTTVLGVDLCLVYFLAALGR